MKFVRLAIGAVIAILSVRIIATNVYGMTQETVKKEVVTFEVLTETTVTSGTYDLFTNNAMPLTDYTITDIYINEVRIGGLNNYNVAYYAWDDNTNSITLVENEYIDNTLIVIFEDDTFYEADHPFEINDIIDITFEVTTPAQLTGISATLILIAPLIFVSGILGMLLIVVPRNKED